MNGPWFDKFHETYPNIPIGCSEYGCEALDWHSSNPLKRMIKYRIIKLLEGLPNFLRVSREGFIDF